MQRIQNFLDKYNNQLKQTAILKIKNFESCRNKNQINYYHPNDFRTLEEKKYSVQVGETIEDYFLNRSLFPDLWLNSNKFDSSDLYTYQYDIVDKKTDTRIEIKSFSQNTISFTTRDKNSIWYPGENIYHRGPCLDLTHPILGDADIIVFCKYSLLDDEFIKVKPVFLLNASNQIYLDRVANKSLTHYKKVINNKIIIGAPWIGLYTQNVKNWDYENSDTCRVI